MRTVGGITIDCSRFGRRSRYGKPHSAAARLRRGSKASDWRDVEATEFIRDVTFKMCDRDFDLDLVESTFADDFVHHGNGATADKAGYLARGREYRDQYASIDRPEFDELFAVDDRVVVAYTLNLHRQDGSSERMAVMAIWTVDDDKVTALREVDATAA